MSDDIVARLRDCTCVPHGELCRESADEIERLREALRIEQEESAACAIDRKETQRERDEARRAVCCSALPSDYKEWKPEDVDAALRLIAEQQGWDCFKEGGK